ncbi:DUF2939 domain-containing protein [Aurantiacibacter marinus]|uniref:DUF2939 domain-containing protein n=1 Tax=Aurantiacibacter marinus TaxID=874156 RepID=UPI00138E32B1|nr:DUF2939 domain-containing protein [Aurantiacibacter marinus]
MLVFGWYLGSPYLAMNDLRAAAESGDQAELENSIDFPQVRESLKSEFRASLAAKIVNSEEQDGLEALGSMFAMGMVDTMVDGLVTPEGMSALITRGRLNREEADGEQAEGFSDQDWSLEREGFSSFRATPSLKSGETPPTLIFERDGLSWRLTAIDMPADVLGN